MSNVASVISYVISTFLILAYIMVMFQIVVDLFRDRSLGGFAKALWIAGLLFIPILTALVYIIARGRGMAERQREVAQQARTETEAYVKRVAGTSSADEIAKAKSLLDAGTIDQEEFRVLKRRALTTSPA